jgi:putative FmdB family regulatory protein
MPTYAYQCEACGYQFEQRQNFNDAPLTVCPQCEGHIRRVISAAGVIFKGSGFYVTDNRKSNNSTAKTAKADEGKAANNTETTAPAASTETAKDSAASPSPAPTSTAVAAGG